jgi:hypothetical protein
VIEVENEKIRTIQSVKKELMRRLNTLGGVVWETPRLNNGAPQINFVWDGQYFGFYPVLTKSGGGGLKPFEREMIDKLTKRGAVVAVVRNVEDMEEAMNLDIARREIGRLLPVNKMHDILYAWGKGNPVPEELETEILRLPRDYQEAIYSIYFDKMTMNRYAEEAGITYDNARMRHYRAVKRLRERLVKKHGVVGDHVIR